MPAIEHVRRSEFFFWGQHRGVRFVHQAGINAGAYAGTVASTDADANIGAYAGAYARTVASPDADTNVGTDPGTNASAYAGTVASPDAETNFSG